MPAKFVFSGHSAGGEVVSYVANRLRTEYPASFARLSGLVLLDPVNSFVGRNMAKAFNGLNTTSLPIHAISSPPYSANGQASGTVELTTDVHRAFLGVRLTTGSHCDAEGAGTDSLCTGRRLSWRPQGRHGDAVIPLPARGSYTVITPDSSWRGVDASRTTQHTQSLSLDVIGSS